MRYAIYLFMVLSWLNFCMKLYTADIGHIGVAAVMVFMACAAWIMTLED